MSTQLKRVLIGVFVASIFLMLWNYASGYNPSIDWEVTTTAEVVEFPAWSTNDGPIEHQITGENYLLKERYSGTEIKRNLTAEKMYLALIWFGICLFLSASSFFNRYVFFVVMAAFALMINRFNLFEIGLFGIESKMVMLLPFICLAAPLVYFHEYRKKTSFAIRLGALVVISVALTFGISEQRLFVDHLIAHSLFPLTIFMLVFLLMVSEEIMFGLLYVVTSGKGGKSNHLHFIIMSLIYVGNLSLYYLNKAGIYENSFFFFDPYILLLISIAIAFWSLKFKDSYLEDYLPQGFLTISLLAIGIISLGFISLSMFRGMDAVHQSFHSFILYFHIGFGAFFLLYIIANFLDPLIKGFSVYKIAYRERNFPYITARLGGLVVIAAFYFFSGQEPYNLLRSGYYGYLSEIEKTRGNQLLSKEYMIQSAFLGYNTHYPNYSLGWMEWNSGNEFRAKTNFFNAAQRHPSPYAWVNYGNLHVEVNPNKVLATYEEALRKKNSPEMKNNLGLLYLERDDTEKALGYFDKVDASSEWNQAPLLNKWYSYKKGGTMDLDAIEENYEDGNFGVKANVLTNLSEAQGLSFQFDDLQKATPLHRQAYLLNASYLLDHDSIPELLSDELDKSLNASNNNRLGKALALHLYQKGQVNRAFVMLDNLQANAADYHKGEFLDILGKLALDQGAYQLSLDYFNKAIKARHENSRFNRLEAFAALKMTDQIVADLLRIIEKNPELTNDSNELLEELKTFSPKEKAYPSEDLASMDSSQLIQHASTNAFNVKLISEITETLKERGSDGGYDILLEAMEINPYSATLRKNYIMAALEWNLTDYAEQALEKLQPLTSESDFKEFQAYFEARKAELDTEVW